MSHVTINASLSHDDDHDLLSIWSLFFFCFLLCRIKNCRRPPTHSLTHQSTKTKRRTTAMGSPPPTQQHDAAWPAVPARPLNLFDSFLSSHSISIRPKPRKKISSPKIHQSDQWKHGVHTYDYHANTFVGTNFTTKFPSLYYSSLLTRHVPVLANKKCVCLCTCATRKKSLNCCSLALVFLLVLVRIFFVVFIAVLFFKFP